MLQRKVGGGQRNTLTGADLSFGIGLTRNWEIGINLPSILNQTTPTNNERIQFADEGLTEIRLNSKYRLFGDKGGGIALVGSASINTLEDNPYLGKSPGPTYILEVVMDKNIGPYSFAVNGGYRYRNQGEPFEGVPVEPLKNQWLYSFAFSRFFSSIDSRIIGEVYGTQPAETGEEVETKRTSTSAEALVGIMHLISHNFAIHGGSGTYLDKTAASPDYRIYAGLQWMGGHETKKVRVVKKKRKPKPKPKPKKQAAPVPLPEPEAPPAPLAAEPQEVFILENVEFIFDSYTRVKDTPTIYELNKFGARLKKNPPRKIIIVGHTDSLGSHAYNQTLSIRRAQAVTKHLMIKFGLDPNIVTVRGRGEVDPIDSNGNYQGRQRNRRVEFKVWWD